MSAADDRRRLLLEVIAERDQALAALDRLAAICAAWAELATALLKRVRGNGSIVEIGNAKEKLLALGVDREALR